MVLANFLRRLHAHAQHGIVDRGQCHIDAEIAHENRALAIERQRIAIFADDEVDNGFVGEDLFRRDAYWPGAVATPCSMQRAQARFSRLITRTKCTAGFMPSTSVSS
jgi:hypothetical protein